MENRMKAKYSVPMAMLAGVGIGAVTVQGIHAQSTPPIYWVAEVDITNPEAYTREFVPKAEAAAKAAGGGRILARGQKVTSVEGAPQIVRCRTCLG